MGREVKRVPLEYDYQVGEPWKGYHITNAPDEVYDTFPVKDCDECKALHSHEENFCMEENTPYCVYYNSMWRDKWFEEVPEGECWQFWETTSEGSPLTPAFKKVDELIDYCVIHGVSTFGDTRSEWKNYFQYELDEEKIEILKKRENKLKRILHKV